MNSMSFKLSTLGAISDCKTSDAVNFGTKSVSSSSAIAIEEKGKSRIGDLFSILPTINISKFQKELVSVRDTTDKIQSDGRYNDSRAL